MNASFGSRKPVSPVWVGLWALYIFLKMCFGSCTLINHKFLFKIFRNVISTLKTPVIKVELPQCWNIKYLDIVTSFLFKWMPRIFCTMINKWNLSRETTQMACRVSFQNRKPSRDNSRISLSSHSDWNMQKLALLNFSLHQWADRAPLYYDFPAKR